MYRLNFFAFCIVFLAFNYSSLAAVSDKLSINGTLWTKFTMDMTDEADPESGFDIYRGLIDINYQIDQHWSAYIKSDYRTTKAKVHLIDAGEAQNTIFSSFINGKNIISNRDQIQMGRIPHPFVVGLYRVLKTRWLSQTLAHESGYFDSRVDGLAYSILFEKFSVAYTVHDGRANGFGKTLNQNTASNLNLKYQKGPWGIFLNGEISKSNLSDGVNGGKVFNSAIFYASDSTKIAFEAARRDTDESSAETGYGATFYSYFGGKFGGYARFFTGDDNWKNSLSLKEVFGIGPVFKLGTAVKGALIYENRNATAASGKKDNKTLSLLLATSF